MAGRGAWRAPQRRTACRRPSLTVGQPGAKPSLTLHICERVWHTHCHQHAWAPAGMHCHALVLAVCPRGPACTTVLVLLTAALMHGSLCRIRDDFYIGCGGALVRPSLVVTAGAALRCCVWQRSSRSRQPAR